MFTEAGRLLRAPDIARQFQALLRRAGLPKFRLYDFRHTFATQLLKPGAPITYVANQLGHTKPHTTLLFYSHPCPMATRRRLEAIRIKGGGDSRVTGAVEQEQQGEPSA